MNAAPQRAHDQEVLISFMVVVPSLPVRWGGVPLASLPGAPRVCHAAETVSSRISDRARCLSGSGRIRVRLSRVSQDRAVRTWSRYSPAPWTRP